MQYVLGNMLNGGGGLNADGLALDLQFALDKTLTARKGPTPVFTRASSATFVGSNGLIQSAATNIPRFDHTSAGVCRGLLIEESRTNLLRGSGDLTTGWSLYNGSTRTPNSGTSPDGSNSASLLSFSALSNSSIEQEALSQPAGSYTFSVYIRADSPTTVRIGTFTPSVVCSVTTAWQRFTVTSTTTSTGTIYPQIVNSAAGGAKSIYVWGAQLEAGSFATSYIPTTTGSVVRSADVCSITGTPFSNMWNTAEGTMYVSGDKTMSTVSTGCYFSASSGASEVGPFMARSSTTLLGRIRNNAALDITNTDVSQSPSGEKKLAVAWVTSSDANTRDFASGGVILTKSNPNAGTPASNQTAIAIGSRADGGQRFNGTISTIRYYRKRLANSKLVALTT